MKLSINQMRAVEAVVRTGSFSAAAKELGISQPSVSNHLSALEKHYRTQLIHRNGRQAEATETCREILSRIRSVLAMTDEIEHALEGRRRMQAGSLRLGYSTYQFAMPILSDFMTQFPEVEIEARAMASNDLLPLLEDGKFDVVFITSDEAPSSLYVEKIRTERIVLVVPPDHPLCGKGSASWQDVANAALVQRENSSGTRRVFEKAATSAGVKLNTVLALGSWGAIVTTINSGMGIGVAMEGEVLPSNNLVIIPIEDETLSVSHYLACLPEMQHVSAIRAMFNALQDNE
ncbi:DNA-binding transcriptional regulator, LysR family [Cohaesibacter marisflavi]|uniref:DNA-binding transcriptional regulator, LysR family n=1 Tax=Cohaesibacter marisflavi TaxID=655353 RepID=A0A1I4ZKC1_9HYPH|nr:LysR substrate-binding domain-containing protein [Cohaesibacter marisflavi]SFN50721.1 DNA-binding transcriptional regulator, LysR family [Cohaesibacter marisflavi]